jgi:hypothetical protein
LINKTCKSCTKSFEIAPEDEEFYKKMKAPHPTHCPDCRLQRVLAWRNEKHLYRRTCDLCQKHFISIYDQDSPYTVYCPKCWWSDKWDPFQYSEEINFDEPFFTQWNRLHKKTPHLGVVNENHSLVNSEYVSFVSDAKNCYLVFASNFLEDCMHSHYIWESKDTVDCSNSTKLELCYECVDCNRLFDCNYCEFSQNSNNCTLCYDIKNCHDCYGCVNLRNKRYHYFNKQLTREEYEEKIHNLPQDQEKFAKLQEEFPRIAQHQIRCENSTGDAIKNCKNCKDCFEGYGGEDLKWVINFPGAMKDCYDIFGCAEAELCLEGHAVGLPAYNVKYSNVCFNGVHDMDYCAYIMNGGRNLFGCISLKKSQYCILNKQYTEAEYHELRTKLIEHMTRTGEWGEFFPTKMSPFPYKLSVAQDYFPK